MKILLKTVALYVVGTLLGCSDPEPLDLINGYKYARTNGYNTYIIKDNQPVVDTYISEYELIGRYIVGSRRKSEFEDAPVGFVSTKYGNFILNTRTGELRESVPNDELSRFKSSIKKPK